MSFDITPGLSHVFNTFNFMEIQGISLIWGALFAIVITLIISSDWSDIKTNFLIVAVMLHHITIYQHFFIFIVGGILFVTEIMSFKVIGNTIKSVTGVAEQATYGAQKALSSLRYGSTTAGDLALELRKDKDRRRIDTLKQELKLKKATKVDPKLISLKQLLDESNRAEKLKTKEANEKAKRALKPALDYLKKKETLALSQKQGFEDNITKFNEYLRQKKKTLEKTAKQTSAYMLNKNQQMAMEAQKSYLYTLLSKIKRASNRQDWVAVNEISRLIDNTEEEMKKITKRMRT